MAGHVTRAGERGGRGGERGYALVGALLAVVVVTGLSVTLAGLAASTSLSSGVDRQRSALGLAAEAGIDLVQGQLAAATTAWPCTSPQTRSVPGQTDAVSVTVTLQYLAADGTASTCTGRPAAVVVTSTATAGAVLRTGTAPRRAMQARFALSQASQLNPPLWAIFGDAGVSFINGVSVRETSGGALDAGIYSNSGTITCNTTSTVQGPIYTQGNVVLRNGCASSGPVWAAGTVDASQSAVQVAGDVRSAATSGTGIAMGNTARVAGNAYANADVSLGDGSVAGSVLSTRGKIQFMNSSRIEGSAYALLGVQYVQGGNGQIDRDVVASRGSLAGPTSQNPGEYSFSVGGSVAASPSGCVANSARITGSVSPAQQPVRVACTLPSSAFASGPAIPATPSNPPGVPATPLPATVAAPPANPFPALYGVTNPVTGVDALTPWRDAGWDVRIFTGASSCNDAMTYLRSAIFGAARPAWVARPLALVIRGCTSPIGWDRNNRELMGGGSTLTLYNDLAVISDVGMGSQNPFVFASDGATKRSLMWIVPTDSPLALGGWPACSPWGDLTPNGVSTQNVAWFLYTPCSVSPQNQFGTASAPLRGAVYGKRVVIDNGVVGFDPMPVPGLVEGQAPPAAAATLQFKRESRPPDPPPPA